MLAYRKNLKIKKFICKVDIVKKQQAQASTDWSGLGWCILIIVVITATSLFTLFG